MKPNDTFTLKLVYEITNETTGKTARVIDDTQYDCSYTVLQEYNRLLQTIHATQQKWGDELLVRYGTGDGKK